jgi:hypothetical protein
MKRDLSNLLLLLIVIGNGEVSAASMTQAMHRILSFS